MDITRLDIVPRASNHIHIHTHTHIQQLTQWRRDGFFIKQNVFDPSDLQPVMKDIEAQVETVAQKLLKAGLITDTCAGMYVCVCVCMCLGVYVCIGDEKKFMDVW
jgi:hypothetical protein